MLVLFVALSLLNECHSMEHATYERALGLPLVHSGMLHCTITQRSLQRGNHPNYKKASLFWHELQLLVNQSDAEHDHGFKCADLQTMLLKSKCTSPCVRQYVDHNQNLLLGHHSPLYIGCRQCSAGACNCSSQAATAPRHGNINQVPWHNREMIAKRKYLA